MLIKVSLKKKRVPAEPGFTEPVFIALKEIADYAEKGDKKFLCSLILDEMAIRKHVCWNGKSFEVYIQ